MSVSDISLCPFCGAYSPRACDLEDEEAGIECPWLEMMDDEPDPDRLREDRDERRALQEAGDD